MNIFTRQSASAQRKARLRLADQLVDRGDRARDAHRWTLASASYGEALELDPSRDWIWVQYGHALKELGDLLKAEVSYRRALSLKPKVGDSYLQLGHVLKLQGNIREAAECYLFALRLEPNSAAARAELISFGFEHSAIDKSIENGVLAGQPYLQNRSMKLWDTIAENLQRMRIERGWLYRTCFIGSNNEVSCSITFVPD